MVASVVVHGGALFALVLSVVPEPMMNQPTPKSGMNIVSQKVDRMAATEQDARGETATTRDPEGTRVGQGAVRRTKAAAADLPAAAVGAQQPFGQTITPVSAAGAVAKPAATKGEILGVAALPASELAEVTTDLARGTIAKPVKEQGDTVIFAALPSSTLIQSVAPQERLVQTKASGKFASASIPQTESLRPKEMPQVAALQPARAQTAGVKLDIQGTVIGHVSTNAIAGDAITLPLPAEKGTAALAWSGADDDVVDPLSLAAIQSFMQPGDLASDADQVRDGISSVLAAVPCARLQTTFLPETGELRLTGHIPEHAMRAPILAALKQQIGTAIPVSDELLILPRPQCNALSGIANVGLPQSTEQLTNSRVVGKGGFARNYSYTEGQQLILELTAADYDGYVYVDFFTADGNVLHLQPNEIVPLERALAKSVLTVGKDRGDKPWIDLTVSPPFGQEIAAAFAASVPLYDGFRPLQEPAGPYLEFLTERVKSAREKHADFKGEWVYFFISTKAK